MCRPLNILVLDDDTENADSLAEVFTLDDHQVVVAYSGQGALGIFSKPMALPKVLELIETI